MTTPALGSILLGTTNPHRLRKRKEAVAVDQLRRSRMIRKADPVRQLRVKPHRNTMRHAGSRCAP